MRPKAPRSRKRRILSGPQCVDDYGTEVYACQYSDALVWADDFCFIGAVVPQVSGSYVCHRSLGQASYRASRRAFDATERNCNTCAHLSRVPHARRFGFLEGVCLSTPVNHPYGVEPATNRITFHPDDWMGMQCYVQRGVDIHRSSTLD